VPGLEERIGMALGEAVQGLEPLRGGCIAEVYRARLADGTAVVVKYDPGPEASLGLEAAMLRFLAKRSSLPVPQVFYAEDDLLVLEYVENDGKVSATTETHAAELLAELHSLSAPRFGFEQDTVIGPLVQPNPWTGSWLAFYREQRLGAMAQEAYRAGTLDETLLGRLERLVDDLDTFIGEPEASRSSTATSGAAMCSSGGGESPPSSTRPSTTPTPRSNWPSSPSSTPSAGVFSKSIVNIVPAARDFSSGARRSTASIRCSSTPASSARLMTHAWLGRWRESATDGAS
jgi:hypothetical protein